MTPRSVSSRCLALAVVGLACGAPLDPADIPDVAGAWSYSENGVRERQNAVCFLAGTLTFRQEMETFVGSFTRAETCTTDGVASTVSRSGQITAGLALLDVVEFRIRGCDYQGIIADDPEPRHISGTVLCAEIDVSGSVVTATGTWQAERILTAAR